MTYGSPPGWERRPAANGPATKHIPSDAPGRAASSLPARTHTTPDPGPVSLGDLSSVCHTDEWGLFDLACMRQVLEAEERAYVRGYAAGRESVYAEIDADVAQVARNAAYSIDVMRARERAKARWAG